MEREEHHWAASNKDENQGPPDYTCSMLMIPCSRRATTNLHHKVIQRLQSIQCPLETCMCIRWQPMIPRPKGTNGPCRAQQTAAHRPHKASPRAKENSRLSIFCRTSTTDRIRRRKLRRTAAVSFPGPLCRFCQFGVRHWKSTPTQKTDKPHFVALAGVLTETHTCKAQRNTMKLPKSIKCKSVITKLVVVTNSKNVYDKQTKHNCGD